MKKFNYTAKNSEGVLVRDMIESDSRQDALTTLRKKGLTVVSLTEMEQFIPTETADAETPGVKERISGWLQSHKGDLTLAPKKSPRSKKIKLPEMAVFCRQLAISVNSGLSLRESLEGIHEDMDQPVLKSILSDIIKRLHDGVAFSTAIAMHKRTFSPIFIGMVAASEQSGSLGETLERLAGYLEANDKLQRKVKSLMAYPAFVVVFFLFICVVMMVSIVPRFQEIFGDLGAELPMLTQFVFGVNSLILGNAAIVISVIALLAIGYVLYTRSRSGRLRTDQIKLKLPVLGKCLKQYITARICRCMSIMLKSGVPISTTLRIIAGIGNNMVIESAIECAKAKIISGSAIAEGLAEGNVFPALLIRMLRVGENTGRLPEVLDRVADAYEDQVEASILAGTSLLEPIIITVMGMMVLVLVLSIYMPVFTVSMKIK